MARTLLFLSADSFHASIWSGGKLGASQYFSNDANGRENFSAFLKQHRDPAYMLVDVIEEDFRLETVPHLTGSARKALLARKFEQFYRGTPFRQATLLLRQTDGRRDDEMMFSALTNPQRISPWLDAIAGEPHTAGWHLLRYPTSAHRCSRTFLRIMCCCCPGKRTPGCVRPISTTNNCISRA